MNNSEQDSAAFGGWSPRSNIMDMHDALVSLGFNSINDMAGWRYDEIETVCLLSKTIGLDVLSDLVEVLRLGGALDLRRPANHFCVTMVKNADGPPAIGKTVLAMSTKTGICRAKFLGFTAKGTPRWRRLGLVEHPISGVEWWTDMPPLQRTGTLRWVDIQTSAVTINLDQPTGWPL